MRISLVPPTGPVMRGLRVATGSVSGTGSAAVPVTWPQAFPDADYTVVATVEDTGSGAGLRAERITARSATGCTVRVANDALGSRSGVLHVMAMR